MKLYKHKFPKRAVDLSVGDILVRPHPDIHRARITLAIPNDVGGMFIKYQQIDAIEVFNRNVFSHEDVLIEEEDEDGSY